MLPPQWGFVFNLEATGNNITDTAQATIDIFVIISNRLRAQLSTVIGQISTPWLIELIKTASASASASNRCPQRDNRF